jgi:hypothetical protein
LRIANDDANGTVKQVAFYAKRRFVGHGDDNSIQRRVEAFGARGRTH